MATDNAVNFDKVPNCSLQTRARSFARAANFVRGTVEIPSSKESVLDAPSRACFPIVFVPCERRSPHRSSRRKTAGPSCNAKDRHDSGPRDVAYPGTIQLTVDASDVTRAIFKVHEHVPVSGPGDFVMLYPKWLPGNHSPARADQ